LFLVSIAIQKCREVFMKKQTGLLCLAIAAGAAFLSIRAQGSRTDGWTEISPDVYRSPGWPAGYALVDGSDALLIDAPHDIAGLAGVKKISEVYLTSYHRASCAQVAALLGQGVPIAAPKGAKGWLSPEGVNKYWQESLPLRNSNTAYLVVATGFDGLRYNLENGHKATWHGWELEIVDTPGHARAHCAVLARKGKGPTLAFTGGAFASPGKLWAPYTTDWDHWTDAGLTPTAKSLRRLAEKSPDILCPAYGAVVTKEAVAALNRSAECVEEVAFLKSFERFTKKRLDNAPTYRFLAREQAESNGSKPWSRISEHLYLTGNTYVLVSKDNACLMLDPWDKRSADQLLKLRQDKNLGPLEVVTFSHAHYDHYDGIYHLPDRNSFQVWTLDQVAVPLAEPNLLRAPFLDARPIRFDKTPRDGDSLSWREYRFRFHHLPGQTEFTMGIETVIDGKKCLFTADNFFHQDMFSGSGGWMGLNRSFPPLYAASAQKVLDLAPDWVLAEHGGPFEFNAEDFRRRVQWGEESARAADALSPSGNHQHDWNPHHIRILPLVAKAKPGAQIKATLVTDNILDRPAKLSVRLEGHGLMANQTWSVTVPAKSSMRRQVTLQLAAEIPAGRHVFPCLVYDDGLCDGSDAFMAVDVE
jgi:glyoxylase-like metal-dependent hydrolase (beta-lactamase superfamily II)